MKVCAYFGKLGSAGRLKIDEVHKGEKGRERKRGRERETQLLHTFASKRSGEVKFYLQLFCAQFNAIFMHLKCAKGRGRQRGE